MSNSITALAVFCIWSMASSIAVMRSLMAPRSKGVIKLRRTAIRMSRVTLSGIVLPIHYELVVFRDDIAALQQRTQGVGAGHDDVRMFGKQFENRSSLGNRAWNQRSI